MELFDKRIVVTGGNGFLGSHIIDVLRERGCESVFVSRHSEYDLRDQEAAVEMYIDLRPDIVIHTAVAGGGIKWNKENPAVALFDNITMGLNLLEGARSWGLKKFVQIGSVCAYPLNVSIPTPEEELWFGLPEPTNGPYGLSKRILSTACQAYRQQYNLNAICLMPVNLYGPRDDFDLQSSHVIAAMVRKFVDAKYYRNTSVSLWGTGFPTREFLYVKDCAEAVVLATENYNSPEPVNVGSEQEISIGGLAAIIKQEIRFEGEILWDRTKPDGQPRRLFNSRKAMKKFSFVAKTGLREGLKKTIEWYRDSQNYDCASGVV